MSTLDFFCSRLDAMIDLRHPLAVLATRMPWPRIEAALAPVFARKARPGQMVEGEDLFGPTLAVAGAGASAAGRPRLPIRLMVGLLYLKHAFNESDESVCERWAENNYWQYFCGQEYFQPRLPCDPTNLVRFRQALGEAGVEELLATTIAAAVQMKAVTPAEFERVIVDTTVQEKAVAYPTDSRLLEVARAKLVQLAQRAGLSLKQTYAREGKQLRRRAGGYAHAKQFKRLRGVLKRQRTILGRLLRDIERKLAHATDQCQGRLREWLERAWRICRQQRKDKNKLYALHAPEVECLGKGKARQPYEFGVKVSLAITERQALIVGARAFAGNPYDGHTLAEQLEQTAILLQELPGAPEPKTALVDLGFRGVDAEVTPVEVIPRGKHKTLTRRQRRWLKRRQAIEPIIGHVKQDHGMKRCWLKGQTGDAVHAVLCATGYNLRWLLRAIARLGLRAVFFALARLHTLQRSRAPLLRGLPNPPKTSRFAHFVQSALGGFHRGGEFFRSDFLANTPKGKPLTADYDLYLILPHIADLGPPDNLSVPDVAHDVFRTCINGCCVRATDSRPCSLASDLRQDYVSDGAFYSKNDPDIGNAMGHIAMMIPVINAALVGKVEPMVHHSANSGNPVSEAASHGRFEMPDFAQSVGVARHA